MGNGVTGAVLALTEQPGTAFSTPYYILHEGTNPAAFCPAGQTRGRGQDSEPLAIANAKAFGARGWR